jgi:hypothetical protein
MPSDAVQDDFTEAMPHRDNNGAELNAILKFGAARGMHHLPT